MCVCVCSLIVSSCVCAYSMPPFPCKKNQTNKQKNLEDLFVFTSDEILHAAENSTPLRITKRFQMHLDNLKNAQRVRQVFLVAEREETS